MQTLVALTSKDELGTKYTEKKVAVEIAERLTPTVRNTLQENELPRFAS